MYAVSDYAGVFKSIDGGATWTNKGLASQYLSGIAIHPSDPNIIYATARNFGEGNPYGIFKSIDGGDTWTTLRSDLNADGLVINVLNSDILYVVSFTDGVYKSIDGGITWVAKNNGLNFTPTVSNPYIGQYVTIALDPTNPNILYAASKGYRELYKSNNSGENWINLYNPDNIYLDGWWGPKSWFAMHTNCIAINPQNSSQVYIGAADFLRIFPS